MILRALPLNSEFRLSSMDLLFCAREGGMRCKSVDVFLRLCFVGCATICRSEQSICNHTITREGRRHTPTGLGWVM